MAKANRSMASKLAKNGAEYYSGTLRGEKYNSHYNQGHEAYANRHWLSDTWHPHKIQGWRKARASDERFLACLIARYNEEGIVPSSKVVDAVALRLSASEALVA